MSKNNNSKKTKKINWKKPFPLLPLRDIVVFPGMVAPLFVGRQKSIKALDAVFEKEGVIMLAAQEDPSINEPTPKDIYKVGCVAGILQILRLPDGTVKALIEGRERATITQFHDKDEMLSATVKPIKTDTETDPSIEALSRAARSYFERYVKLSPHIPNETIGVLSGIEFPGEVADVIAANLICPTAEKQAFLESTVVKKRLEKLTTKLQSEIEILQIERRVRNRVKKQMEKSQKDYYLTEQMRAIQKELGKDGGTKTDAEEIREKIIAAKMPEEVEKKALKELSKLELMPPMSAEGSVSRNYIDWLLDVPWSKTTRDKLDIKSAGKILDEDHFGLEKVKERILEYLAVRKLVKKMKGPILCFVGPPGVGKTSLGKSIARAMGRKFARFSLGGVRDEAEIRGHRRTYIGAMPGKIIQAMKKTGVKNPVIMLDEVDKLSSDFRGDPSSALLEALDPEQNQSFNDHYLDVDYDLSEVMFITTANLLHPIPSPLQDRMEVIHLSGYTDDEKENIARKFLAPKQEKEHGLPQDTLNITDEALNKIVRNYTREAGVRNLERELAHICRKIARKIAERPTLAKKKTARLSKVKIDSKDLVALLGEIKYRDEVKEKEERIGVVTGLAWTEMGGSILKVETSLLEGKGNLILTGKLGEVMRESAQAALTFIRSRAKEFGLPKGFHSKTDIHIHIPEGAIPKEGPSAGITLATAMASAFLKIPVRNDVAMTGEITLGGQILPIGGLKEKLLAANRAGIKVVLAPEENGKDLREIPDNVKKGLDIKLVKTMDEVLGIALLKRPGKKGSATKSTKYKPRGKQSRGSAVHRSALN